MEFDFSFHAEYFILNFFKSGDNRSNLVVEVLCMRRNLLMDDSTEPHV